MDGVMIDSEPLQLESFNVALRPYGVVVDQQDFVRECVGRTADENLAFLRARFDLTESVAELANRKHVAYWQLLQSAVKPMPGLLALVDGLLDEGYVLAIASSSRRDYVDYVLGVLELGGKFVVTVSGDDVAEGKPDPAIFLEASRRLGIVPARCVVLEDSKRGVVAANSAGMRCIAISGPFGSAQDLSLAGATVAGLVDILPMLVNLARLD